MAVTFGTLPSENAAAATDAAWTHYECLVDRNLEPLICDCPSTSYVRLHLNLFTLGRSLWLFHGLDDIMRAITSFIDREAVQLVSSDWNVQQLISQGICLPVTVIVNTVKDTQGVCSQSVASMADHFTCLGYSRILGTATDEDWVL